MDISRRSRAVVADQGGGLIIGWIGKIVIGLALTGLVIFDGGSILVNFFTLDSTADEIAIDLSTDIGQTRNQRQLEDRARELATDADARLLGVEVDADNVVRVRLRRRADTLVVGRISFIKDWARATVEGQAGTT